MDEAWDEGVRRCAMETDANRKQRDSRHDGAGDGGSLWTERLGLIHDDKKFINKPKLHLTVMCCSVSPTVP